MSQVLADHGLETRLARDPRRLLVALDAGKGSNPVRIGLNDAEPLADLGLADLNARRLPFHIGAERESVDLLPQDDSEELGFSVARHLGEIRTEKPREPGHLVPRTPERHGRTRSGFHGEVLVVRSRHG